MNVSSRVIRAGFTGTRWLLVSAVPSAGIGGPAPLLGGPGIEVMLLAPSGQIDRGVEVALLLAGNPLAGIIGFAAMCHTGWACGIGRVKPAELTRMSARP